MSARREKPQAARRKVPVGNSKVNDNLPGLGVIAEEIVEDLWAALEELEDVGGDPAGTQRHDAAPPGRQRIT